MSGKNIFFGVVRRKKRRYKWNFGIGWLSWPLSVKV